MTDLKQPGSTDTKQAGIGENGNGAGDNGHAPVIPPVQPPPTVSTRTPTPEEVVDSLRFMFAVGIECSNPVIAGNHRVDELESTGHYEHWKKDLRLVRGLGLRYLRYGPPIHKIFLGRNKYDWSWLDQVMAEMQKLGIRPIIDLVHFGRSEERRVGKEGRCRWAPSDSKQKRPT